METAYQNNFPTGKRKSWYKFCYCYIVLTCSFNNYFMKKFVIISILVALFAAGSTLMAQDKQEDYLGLPGDNLNLYAVMKLFQQSKTLEEFERNLNDPNSNINNLDLNGDNLVDYIKVFDDVDGDVHNIVLQVAVSPKENQDVAVFTVQRFNNGQVQIQLTGDEELYGKNYIVEPIYDDRTNAGTPNPGYTGTSRTVQNITYVRTSPVEIAAWPLVRFMFMPSYTIWHSSWYWGYYPTYWHPWRPFSWNYYYGYHYNWNNDYYAHYRRLDNHRYTRWNDFYYNGRRSYSPDVNHRLESGYYKSTYSHPDQRKDGEEMFAKTHPDQYRRSSAMSSPKTLERRTDNPSRNPGQPNGNVVNASRRTNTTITNTNKPAVNPSYNRNSGTMGKSPASFNNRTTVNKSNGNGNITTSRSSTTVVRRPENNNAAGHNEGIKTTTVRQKSTTVSSANRRTENKAKPANTVKKDNNSKETDNKDSARRR